MSMRFNPAIALGLVLLSALLFLLVLGGGAHAAAIIPLDAHVTGFAMVMTVAPQINHRARGLMSGVRNEGDAQKIFEDLKKSVEAFKASHEEELKGIKNKFNDVVTTEKVDKINNEITSLQKALDDVNAMIAASKLGGASDGAETAEQREHRGAFNKWFRKGADAGLADLEVKAALTTQSDPDGGFLVPTQTETTIDRVLGTVSTMRQLATVMLVGTDTYTKFVNMGGSGAGWVGEEESRPETGTPTLREIVLTVMELYANPFTTQKMLDDGIIDIAAWLADEVSITFAEKEGAAFISGDGVKKPRGILAYDTVANASYAWGSLGFIVSGGASGFASSAPADALIDLYYGLKAGYRTNASFLTSDATMGPIRKMKDGQGNYLWRDPSAPGDVPTILGKPVYTDDNMPAVAANAFPVAFGDFKRGYMVADRTGIRVLRDPYTNKPKVGFYTTKRVGGGVTNFEAIKLLKITAS
ncbi:phage major capsid protein [Agrobacterium vitis]|uniref:phage major capsid protein n=1 Tax=Agrobacterium vitis TaxID=373 RepID=UPI0018D2013E|nr:phage major capsid protein [Agrobacterium vitis]